MTLVERVLWSTLLPSGDPPGVHLPRFRAEMGWFLGAYSGIRLAAAVGGYETQVQTPRFQGELEVGLRAGMALDAVIGSVGDGLMYLQAGATSQSAQFDGPCGDCPVDTRRTHLLPRVPARAALTLRLRVPFWVVPGDLLFMAPILGPLHFKSLKAMGMKAGGGGALGLERVLVTSAGRVQLVVGREVGLTLFGQIGGEDPFQSYRGGTVDAAGTTRPAYDAVRFRSIEVDVPIVEYRPFRDFLSTAAVTFIMQSGVAVDVPLGASVIATGSPYGALGPSFTGYVRIAFDGRLYL